MDLSYSSAWQLGKTLAISDTSFSDALSRLRSTIQTWAASQTRAQTNGMTSRKTLIVNLGNTTKALDTVNSWDVSDPRRITAPTNRTLAPPLDHPSVTPIFMQTSKTLSGKWDLQWVVSSGTNSIKMGTRTRTGQSFTHGYLKSCLWPIFQLTT